MISRISTRIALVGAALASTLALLVSLAPGTAAASVGFCEFASLNSSKPTCKGPGPGPVTQIDAEVTSGNAEICVRLNEGNGVTVFKKCGHDFAATEAGGVTGFPEITDPSGASITVFGIFNT
jgi:hypothetical protein